MSKDFTNIKFSLCFVLLAFVLPIFGQNAPLTARIENVTDDYFGTKIVDPYRWMENQKSDEVQKWMKGQADYADAYFRKLPLRAEFLKRLEELSAKRSIAGRVRRFGNLLLYWRLAAGENAGRYVVRDIAGGAETVVIDLEKMSAADGKNYAVKALIVSPDEKLLAYSIYSGGSEDGEIRVLEIATGKDLGVLIKNDAQPQSWLPDSKSFLYQRLEEPSPNAKPDQREEKKRVRLHTLGTDQKNDREIFGYGVNPEIVFAPTDNNYAVTVPPGSRYAFGWVNTISTNHELYVAPVAEFAEKVPVKWRKIGGLEDEIFASDYREYKISVRGDELYLATTKNAPRGKIIRLDLKNPNLTTAEIFFAEGAEIVFNLRAAKDAFYVQTLDGGASKLYRVDFKTRKRQPIAIPANGSAWALSADETRDGLLFGTDSWVEFANFLNFNPRKNRLEKLVFAGADRISTPAIEVVAAQAKSYDGTLVPLVILHKKGLKLDGTHPTLVSGYGAYGINMLEPKFSVSLLPWLERGGVYAIAGVRGGGEYGEAWRLGGFQKTKPNTWKDFTACAEYLVEKKYTTPKHLAGQGRSAGGVLINNAVVERPDLFAAAISGVGLTNALRFELTSNGSGNVAEFSSVKTEEGFKNLLAMDAYHKVKTDVKYPAVLFTHGANDRRVEPWLSAKMAARLQAATTSGKPVLLRLDYDAGHGQGSSRKQQNEETADVYAFLFEHLGATNKQFVR